MHTSYNQWKIIQQSHKQNKAIQKRKCLGPKNPVSIIYYCNKKLQLTLSVDPIDQIFSYSFSSCNSVSECVFAYNIIGMHVLTLIILHSGIGFLGAGLNMANTVLYLFIVTAICVLGLYLFFKVCVKMHNFINTLCAFLYYSVVFFVSPVH